jgi:hypothetical protein
VVDAHLNASCVGRLVRTHITSLSEGSDYVGYTDGEENSPAVLSFQVDYLEKNSANFGSFSEGTDSDFWVDLPFLLLADYESKIRILFDKG